MRKKIGKKNQEEINIPTFDISIVTESRKINHFDMREKIGK